MSNLDDLPYKSILSMDNDEALELIRQTRLRRRETKKSTSKAPSKSKPAKTFDFTQLTDEMKQELLELIGEDE